MSGIVKCASCGGDMYHYAGCGVGEHGERIPLGGPPAERPPEPSDEPAFDKCGECDHCRGEHGVDGCRCITVEMGGEYPCSCKVFDARPPATQTGDVKESARDLLALLLRHGTLVPDDLHRALRAAGVAERRDPLEPIPSATWRDAVAAWQADESVHPLTCGNDSRHDNLFVGTKDGKHVLLCPQCNYVQKPIPQVVMDRWLHWARLDAAYAIDRRGTGAEPTAGRMARLEYLKRMGGGDERGCGHPDLVAHPDCVECAYDLGKRSGHAEAGAYYTWDEVKAKLRAEFGDVEDETLPELVRFFRDEEAEWGHKGDYEDWSPERSAIELIRSLRGALRAGGPPEEE